MSNTKPKVSILVLTYSHERFIHACLSSLVSANYPNTEIIVLDDGSPDRTADVAEGFAENSSVPVRVIRQQNTGKTAANAQKLIDLSDGPYFMLIAGDDMLGPAYPVDQAVAQLEANSELGLVSPRHIQLDDDPSRATLHVYDPLFVALLRSGDPERILKEHLHRRVSLIFLQGMVIRRRLAESAGGFDVDLVADDYAFVFRIFSELHQKHMRFWFNENAFWIYRTHVGNVHKNAVRQITLIMEVAAKYVPPERWTDFDWPMVAVDTHEDFDEIRSQAVALFGPMVGAKLTERVGRLTTRRARDHLNEDLLRQFCQNQNLPTSLERRVKRYYHQVRAKKWKSKVTINLALAAAQATPGRVLMKMCGFDVCRLGLIRQEASEVYKLVEPCTQSTIPPNFGAGTQKARTSQFSELNAFVLNNATVSAETNQLIANGRLLAPQYRVEQRGRVQSNCPMLGFYDDKYAQLKPGRTEKHEKAILVGGDGASNWYHFIVEIAPKAYLASLLPDAFREYPIIVPECALSHRNFAEVMKILLPGRELISLRAEAAEVENLVVFDEVALGPFNLYLGQWPKESDYSQHEIALKTTFAKLRGALVSPKYANGNGRRVFLVRPAIRRNYNQRELLSIAGDFGFEAVSPEHMTLGEQAQMFSEASHVIGASGAAWTGMVFSESPIKGLTWIYPEFGEFCVYSSLSHMLGHDLRFIESVPDKKLNSTYEAHTASYNVPEKEFENALASLCETR